MDFTPTAKLSESFKDPRKLKLYMDQNKKFIGLYFAFIFGILGIYFFFSSGDFSFILTLASLVQMFGFALLLYRVKATRSLSGLSLNSVICYGICLLARISSITFFEGYLPYDSSGEYIYIISEYLSLATCFAIIVLMIRGTKTQFCSYEKDLDFFQWWWFALPTFLLACMFHPSLNLTFIADVPWTWALYLETLAMFPQLHMFRKKGGEIESFTSHYVASQGVSKILQFVFWLASFQELNEEYGETSSLTPKYVGYYVIIAQLVQVLMMGEYLFYYFKTMRSGGTFILP